MSEEKKARDTVEILEKVEVPGKYYDRVCTGNKNIDQIFGGEDMPGIMPSMSILFSGLPGAGKSTLALQFADMFQREAGVSVLYNSGEQKKPLIKIMANRLRLKGQFCVAEFEDVYELVAYAKETGVDIIFADSIQSLTIRGEEDVKGIGKVLIEWAQDTGGIVFLVGQITKAGEFAGPMQLKHDVDAHAHLYFNKDTGNRVFELQKNRMGPAMVPHEFCMSANGMTIQEYTGPREGEKQPDLAGGGRNSSAARKKAIIAKAKEIMLAGHVLDGYSRMENTAGIGEWAERELGGISDAYWRGILETAANELAREGHGVARIRQNGRNAFRVTPKKEEN